MQVDWRPPPDQANSEHQLRVVLVSVSDGIGGARAAFGGRAVVEAHVIESDESLRSFTQMRYLCSAERFAEDVDLPALVHRINSASWGV